MLESGCVWDQAIVSDLIAVSYQNQMLLSWAFYEDIRDSESETHYLL